MLCWRLYYIGLDTKYGLMIVKPGLSDSYVILDQNIGKRHKT